MKEKLKKYIQSKREQMQRGLEVTQQMKAEKQRRKLQRMKYYEPGTMRYGLAYKQNPVEFMEDVKKRRKQKREETK